MENEYNDNLPEVHEIMSGLRPAADNYNAVLMGETWTENVANSRPTTKHHDELQMPMDLMFTKVKFFAGRFREQLARWTPPGVAGVLIGNHDIVRSWNRYGDGTHNDQIAKDMAAIYLTLRGTPIMYYGEEIGMQNNDPKRKEDVKDPIGRIGWPREKGRDGERTPMQWSDNPNAGFTTGIPWNPIPVAYKTYNVADELKDPNSILNWYKALLVLRRHDQALLERKIHRFESDGS